MKAEVVFMLDEHQTEIVKPLFDKVRLASEAGEPGMVLCQLWGTPGKIRASVRFIDEDMASAIIAAVSAIEKEAA